MSDSEFVSDGKGGDVVSDSIGRGDIKGDPIELTLRSMAAVLMVEMPPVSSEMMTIGHGPVSRSADCPGVAIGDIAPSNGRIFSGISFNSGSVSGPVRYEERWDSCTGAEAERLACITLARTVGFVAILTSG